MTKTPLYPTASRTTLAMGTVGAVVGCSAALARNYGKIKNNETTREEAVKDVLKETGTSGLATATATAVVGAVNMPVILSLASMVVVAATTKYLADSLVAGKCSAPEVEAAEAKAPAKKAPAKKATAKKTSAKKAETEET